MQPRETGKARGGGVRRPPLLPPLESTWRRDSPPCSRGHTLAPGAGPGVAVQQGDSRCGCPGLPVTGDTRAGVMSQEDWAQGTLEQGRRRSQGHGGETDAKDTWETEAVTVHGVAMGGKGRRKGASFERGRNFPFRCGCLGARTISPPPDSHAFFHGSSVGPRLPTSGALPCGCGPRSQVCSRHGARNASWASSPLGVG